MDLSNQFILLSVIIFGNAISIIIFLSYYFTYRSENSNIPLYIVSKIIQAFCWLSYIFLFNENLNLPRYSYLLPNLFLVSGAAIEIFCLISLTKKDTIRLKINLFLIVFLNNFIFLWLLNDDKMRIVIHSITISILFSYLFVYNIIQKSNFRTQTIIGWISFIFILISGFRAIFTYSSNSEVTAFTMTLVNIISAFMWIAITYTFPIFYLFTLKELDNLKLEDYKNTLESKVKLRTQELEASLEREKELGILKTNFVSMASHEFRTPLTAINATADVIKRYKEKLSNEEIDIRLNKIKSEVSDMTNILEDILIIGRSDSKNLHYNPTKFNFLEYLNTIISDYQLNEFLKRTISISAPENEQIFIKADRKWIKHIIINLLTNAIKYSDDDTPIEIVVTPKKNEFKFSIKDYGIGIPKNDLEHLFEPFYRAQNTGKISGTGLGLVILKQAIELHNGTIDVQSEVGKGTTFTVTIPQSI